MTTYTGNSGSVKIGTTTLGEVRRFTSSEQANPIDDTALGDANKTWKAGSPDVGGSIECWFDPGDAGQTALTVGAQVALTLYPQGVGSGNAVHSCTAEVTGIEGPDVGFDEIIKVTFTWKAASTYTKGTQT